MVNCAIILVRPQLGVNIGAAARVMLNFGLTDLRIVSPRDGWPNPEADAMSAGAMEKINVTIFDNLAEAIADTNLVYATSARQRYMNKEVITPKQMVKEITATNAASAIVFGPERSGLDNDEIAKTSKLVTIPVNPDFPSLNLAQSVAVLTHALSENIISEPLLNHNLEELATQAELDYFLSHLIYHLDNNEFFRVPEKRPGMVRSIHNIFKRINNLTSQDVRTLHGMVRSLVNK